MERDLSRTQKKRGEWEGNMGDDTKEDDNITRREDGRGSIRFTPYSRSIESRSPQLRVQLLKAGIIKLSDMTLEDDWHDDVTLTDDVETSEEEPSDR